MQLIINLPKLKQYATQYLGLTGEVQALRVTELTGGCLALGLYQHDLVLETASENGRLYQALASLPLTLTHGDVHPGNIIQPSTAPAVLIDWGNARVAPAMLDVANLIKLGAESWQQYLSAWAEVTQEPLNSHLAQLGYHWATIMVNTQYLPYAVDFTPPENVAQMVIKIVEAQKKIAELLD